MVPACLIARIAELVFRKRGAARYRAFGCVCNVRRLTIATVRNSAATTAVAARIVSCADLLCLVRELAMWRVSEARRVADGVQLRFARRSGDLGSCCAHGVRCTRPCALRHEGSERPDLGAHEMTSTTGAWRCMPSRQISLCQGRTRGAQTPYPPAAHLAPRNHECHGVQPVVEALARIARRPLRTPDFSQHLTPPNEAGACAHPHRLRTSHVP